MPWKKGILDRNGILKAISTFVVCGKHPVTVVEGFGFRHLMSIVCPESVNVSIRDIKRDIISSYLKERDNIKELLGKATGKVKLIEFCYTKVCGDKADVLVNHTVRTLYVLFDEYKLNSMASSSCSRTSAVPAVAEHGNVDGDEFKIT
ncbi:hypothetical protein HPP92_024323 [Vanilla planifolia]|uniref:Uncharacterized protein n=1 Tax=Vanilla planifolia TaxID=51239 RepID=A0A835PJF6_VANPL|nr:hypothetical protein HPP92_024323 [Vanilla planifolia]